VAPDPEGRPEPGGQRQRRERPGPREEAELDEGQGCGKGEARAAVQARRDEDAAQWRTEVLGQRHVGTRDMAAQDALPEPGGRQDRRLARALSFGAVTLTPTDLRARLARRAEGRAGARGPRQAGPPGIA